tara:strand:+ start:2356 stop:3015 length:660 start_codon:yes stop_codon:yes gene_type:complete
MANKINYAKLPDEGLVALAKIGNNGATKEIIERHSGLFMKITDEVLNKIHLKAIKKDFQDDRHLIFWDAIQRYDDTKGCKFPSWLGNLVKWKALDQIKFYYRRSSVVKSIGSFSSEGMSKGQSQLEELIMNTVSGGDNDRLDVSFVEDISREEELALVKSLIEQIPKEKEKKVVKLRLFDDNKKTWRDIAQEIGYCRQQTMNIFNKQIKNINKKYQNYA